MLWLSADIAEVTGLALWRGPDLVRTAVLAKVGAKGRYRLGDVVYENEMLAWLAAFRASAPLDDRPAALVVEGPAGGLNYKTAVSLAERRGRIDAWWLASAPGRSASLRADVNAWRAVARKTLSLGAMAPEAWVWPKDGAACKPIAQQLVREHYKREVTEDEADAVMVGHWGLRTRAVEV